jgi:hypothetical protein
MSEIDTLREQIRNTLREAKKTQKKQFLQEKIEEYKLRKIIRKVLKEAEDIVTHESTGINVLADLLETIIPILKSFYKKLGTDIQQRKSFRSHIIKSVQNMLAPIAVMFKAGGTIGNPVTPRPQVSDNELVEADLDEKVKLKVGDQPETDPAFIPLKADRKEKEEKQKEVEPNKEPKAEDTFVEIEGEDETGRNIALQAFKRVEKQTREAYSILANQDDRDLFYDYLITNLKLYFDKFEDELQATVPEPTTSAYEDEKKRKEASLTSPVETPEETPPTPEETPET